MVKRQKARKDGAVAKKAHIKRLKILEKDGAVELSDLNKKMEDVEMEASSVANQHKELKVEQQALCTKITDLKLHLEAVRVKLGALSKKRKRGSVFNAMGTFSNGW